MKKNYLIICALFLAVFLISGCASLFTGFMNDSASLGSKNFSYVKTAQGEAEATYVLGFGGMKKKALAAEAKSDLTGKNPLRDGQALANVIIDYNNTIYFGVVIKTKVIITADIVEFRE